MRGGKPGWGEVVHRGGDFTGFMSVMVFRVGRSPQKWILKEEKRNLRGEKGTTGRAMTEAGGGGAERKGVKKANSVL